MQGFAGIITVATRIFTKAVIPSLNVSTIIFFTSSLVVTIICLVAFLLAEKTPYVQFHAEKCRNILAENEETELVAVSVTLT